MNVYILTLPIGTNYGGIMQAYALRRVIENMGHNAITVRAQQDDMPLSLRLVYWAGVFRANFMRGKNLYFRVPKRRIETVQRNTEKFIEKFIKTTPKIRIHREPKKLAALPADVFVVGSDQVWRPGRVSWANYDAYFFAGIAPEIKRVAYAASFGFDNVVLPRYARRKYSALLAKFSAVSVRESSGVEICRREFGADAALVLDPTMLLDGSDYSEIAESESSARDSDYCFEYVLDKTPFKNDIVKVVSSVLCAPVRKILPAGNVSDANYSDEDCVLPPVEDWLGGIKNAKFAVTDSFHGTVFSILFHVPFAVLGNRGRGLTRIASLLEKFGLESRFVDSDDSAEIEKLVSTPIDWGRVDSVLQREREASLRFLKNSIEKA